MFNFNKKKLLTVILPLLLNTELTNGIVTIEKCINKGDFAITFDDGPSLEYTSHILDVLDAENVKATFFVNGKNTCDIEHDARAQALIKREFESGHVIGSHTYSHPFGITTLTDEELTYEITHLNEIIYGIIGVRPAFFRPPLGEYDSDSLKVIERCGITANIIWNLDSEDWDVNYNCTQQYIDNLGGKEPSSHSWISLNHDIQKRTSDYNLAFIIPYIRSLGYNFVTMDVCTGLSPYQTGSYVKPVESSTKAPSSTTAPAKTTTTTNTQSTSNPNNGSTSGSTSGGSTTGGSTSNGSENPNNGGNNGGNNGEQGIQGSATSTPTSTVTSLVTPNNSQNLENGSLTLKIPYILSIFLAIISIILFA